MIIKINDEFRINFDGTCFTAQFRQIADKSGNENWPGIGYYKNLDGAVKGIANKLVGDAEKEVEMMEFVKIYRQTLADLTTILNLDPQNAD